MGQWIFGVLMSLLSLLGLFLASRAHDQTSDGRAGPLSIVQGTFARPGR